MWTHVREHGVERTVGDWMKLYIREPTCQVDPGGVLGRKYQEVTISTGEEDPLEIDSDTTRMKTRSRMC